MTGARGHIKYPETHRLADRIITSQLHEIGEMKRLAGYISIGRQS
ncbi:hypothetical protein [Sphingosinicella rhizophila]|uniref:Uncharacterized protein n=1 Tax=Sphingosinicella rhizophila TaxID=3050082 RepID=A0ABU3Q8S5_9SPHN|nr:hypothetical protein [Sphingosinicella sp. GR2756]MDT9599383.1 hypothetical protein [Sphingosinicella sp. GR2756]